MINWNKATKYDYKMATEIAKRATALFEEVEAPVSRNKAAEFQRTMLMDIIAVHVTSCALDLNKLLTAERFDFSHDVFGIRRHLNRENGQLEDCFLPRCAARYSVGGVA